MNIIYIFTVISFLTLTNAFKILLLAPFNSQSHWLFLEHFLRELINRGHLVTCITSQPAVNIPPENYTEILIDPPLNLRKFVTPEDVYKSTYNTDFSNVKLFASAGRLCSYYGLKDPKVQELIRSKNLDFDLVINEQMFQESWLMFGYKFNAPLITISTYGTSDFFDRAMGMLTPWSHVPHVFLSYTDNMSFKQRFYNVILSSYDWIYRNWIALPEQNRDAKEFFGHLEEERGQPIPSVEELERNISLILVNSHRSLAPPRPTMPGIVNIGGAHIKPPKPLPDDIQKIMDNAEHGVIYFSLGAFMRSAQMPKEKLSIFLEVFSKLKQTILWKFENESLPNLPSNVFIRKWMPQSDILAHKNVILFITHGGMFGTSESVYRGVPMLFIPLFGDQYRNGLRAEMYGYGRVLKFIDVKSSNLLEFLIEMTANEIYRDKAKEISSKMQDNLVHPMDEAMFWIEYVGRHKGANHLKSHAASMSWFSYLLFDVLFVFGLVILLFTLLLFSSIKMLFKKRNYQFIKDKKK